MSSKAKGIMYILSAALCFAIMNTFVKLSGDLPAIQKCFFRNLVAGIIAVALILRKHQSIIWKKVICLISLSEPPVVHWALYATSMQ